MTFTAPVHAAGAVNITVTTPGGAVTLPLTYVAPAAPTVVSLSATSVSTRAATQLTVTGTSFVGTVTATVDGKTVSASKVSDTQVRITAPAHAAGTVPVVIKAAGGASAPASLARAAPAAAVSAVSPATGSAVRGAVVTINGSSFTGTTSVKIGDTAVTYQVVSDAALRVTIPAKTAGTYVVTVTTASGTSAAGHNTKYTARA